PLIDDLYVTLIAQEGVGLAAIQVAVRINFLEINLPNEEDIQDKYDLIEAIHPVITHKDATQVLTEGCLSVPGFSEAVTRA
ncbi:peptide deformylase, partial [Aliarcobacter butzleri]|uniref:peptide deformylase n=1 Tax=Aliarcobacter butzleri TaxID=28197 RepID=UPI003B22727D